VSATSHRDDATPLVSVVIPCRNGAATLGAQLDAVLGQQAAWAFEVIVANDGSTDATAALVDAYAARDDRVRRIEVTAPGGINAGRNQGVRAAAGSHLLLCDSDDVVRPGWLAAYVDAFAGGAQAVAGGLDFTLPNGREIVRHRRLFTFELFARASPWGYGANCGFTRAAFDAVGGFDERFTLGNDDIDFFIRLDEAGIALVLVPEAVVTYYLRDGVRSLYRQHFNHGRADVQFFMKWQGSGAVRPVLWSHPGSLRRALRYGARDVARRRDVIRIVAIHHGRIREAIARRVLCS